MDKMAEADREMSIIESLNRLETEAEDKSKHDQEISIRTEERLNRLERQIFGEVWSEPPRAG